MYYYFDGITKIENVDFNNIIVDEKCYESILIYGVPYKTLISGKPSCFMFDKVDW